MLNISTLVGDATGRAHKALCTDPESCSGPTEVELMITAYVLESTLPKILSKISLELKQALHAMAAGEPTIGDPDATDEDPEVLLGEWLSWWHQSMHLIEHNPPSRVQIRTAAYLAAREVQGGLSPVERSRPAAHPSR